mgnify:CR=1 FL=1
MKKYIQFITLTFVCSILFSTSTFANDKIKIGLIVPLSGEHREIGESIINSVRLAINKINSDKIQIIPRDTKSNPEETLKISKELYEEGVRIILGPVFNKNLIYLDELQDVTFLSLTNKVIDNPKNIISAGINANSQLKTIIKFQKLNEINKTIFLIPKENYKEEIEKAIKQSKIKTKEVFYYDSDPTKLTSQIEKITKYYQRKQNLEDEIKRLENSDEISKEKKIKILEKQDTLGKVDFDSIIISDFDESLKSITTSLLYTDVSPKKIYFITLNQWFDESLLKETNLQPIYFPSINKENYDKFINIYHETFNEYPNQLSFLSYDLVGLVYYLAIQNNLIIDKKMFLKKNMFKGKMGIFEVKDNKINGGPLP